MSYILDALNRAEAERERGGVPGLHAHQAPAGATPLGWTIRQRANAATAAVVAIAIVAAGLWAWYAPGTTPPERQATLPQTTPFTAPMPSAPLVATSASAAPVARVVAPRPASVAPAPDMAPVAKLTLAPASASKTTDAVKKTAAKAPLLAELPEDVRRQIPALSISGAVYSENPAQRLLLVNGQVLTQGSTAATDLTLEQIGATSSEFSFRGNHFRIAH